MVLPKPFSSSSANSLAFLGALLRRLSTAAAIEAEKPHFLVEYLQTSCGLSSAEATKAAKALPHLRSTKKPDSFLGFMRAHGFQDSQLRRIVSYRPRLLCQNVEKTLTPKFRSLETIGFSGSDLTSLIASNPNFLNFRVDSALLERIKFWESLFGSRDSLIKALKTQGTFWLLPCSMEECALPNISFLRNCGVSDRRLAFLLNKSPRLVALKPEKFNALVRQVEKMGIPRSSGMFLWGLYALSLVSKARLRANLELMKSFGWSEADFLSAFHKAPLVVALSRKGLSEKMDFLVKEAGLGTPEVVSNPRLLSYSLEKRMVPRHRVIQMLRSRKLLGRECKLNSTVTFTNEEFIKKYVTPYKDKVPELEEIKMV